MSAVLDNPAIAMYGAAALALMAMIGCLWYVWAIDRRVDELRRRLDERPAPASTEVPSLHPRPAAQEQRDDTTHD